VPLTKLQRTEDCFCLKTLSNKLIAYTGIMYATCTSLRRPLDLKQNIWHTWCCYRPMPTFAKYLVFEIPNTRQTRSIWKSI